MHRIDEERKLVAFRRWHEGGPGDDVVVVANFGHEARGVYRIGFPREGLWKLRLNTDWTRYSEDFGGLASIDVSTEVRRAMGCPGLPKLPLALTAR